MAQNGPMGQNGKKPKFFCWRIILIEKKLVFEKYLLTQNLKKSRKT